MKENDGEMTAEFRKGTADNIRILMAKHGYTPLLLVGVNAKRTVWIGLHPDVGERPHYGELVRKVVVDLVDELAMMAVLDGIE